MAQQKRGAQNDTESSSLPASLPPRPPKPTHTHSDEDEPPSPPRKRPRTKDVPRPPTEPSAQDPMISPSTSVKDWALPPSVSRFPIQPLHRFHGASASIKRPQEVAHFSYDDNHTYVEDKSGINYYYPPQIGADLKEGFATFRHYEDETDPHLDSLLCALASKERKTGAKEEADFVTWRGMMTKIMTAPFDMFAEFEMFATLYDGTVYIEEDFPTRAAQRTAEAARPAPPAHHNNAIDHRMMTYWGYKFETVSLLPTPPSETSKQALAARTETTVSNYAQHCSIVRTSFGPHTLLLGGEVDGLSAPLPLNHNPSDPIPWIELKTAEQLPPHPSHRDTLKFERKLLKFWAQSFLLGVPKIIVGWRSKQGILTGVQELETGRIPGIVRSGTRCWDGNVCINFAAQFLGWLKEVVKGEGEVYKVRMGKKTGVVEVIKIKGVEERGGIVSRDFEGWRKEFGARESAGGASKDAD